VDRKGRVTADFAGFPGEECREEEEKLRQLLIGLGVVLEQTAFRPKDPAEIAAELGVDEEQGKDVRHR